MLIGIRTKFNIGDRAFYNKNGESYLGMVSAIQYYTDYKGHESLVYTFVSDGGFHKFYIRESDIKRLNIFQKLYSLWSNHHKSRL